MAVLEPTPGTWYSIDEAAALCNRTPGTIRQLVYLHKVPRKLLRWRPRRPTIFLPADSVRFLQSITLEYQRRSKTPASIRTTDYGGKGRALRHPNAPQPGRLD